MKITSTLCNIVCTTLILGILVVVGAFILYWYQENGEVFQAFVNIGEFIVDTDSFIQDIENTISLIKETNVIVTHNSRELLEIKELLGNLSGINCTLC